jgi:hypothetical protein
MKVFETIGILGIIGVAVAGTVFGIVVFSFLGIWAGFVGAILGGIASLFIGLNAICMIKVVVEFWWGITGRRRHPRQKEANKDE